MSGISSLPPGEDPARLPPSLWAATACDYVELPCLNEPEETDVAVIGGGFTGLSTALHLAEEGRNVTVLDAATPGWGASGRNGGQVVALLKWSPDEVLQKLGPKQGQRLISMADGGPNLVFDIIRRYAIDCQPLQTGWMMGIHKPSAAPRIQALARSWERHGAAVEMIDAERTASMIGSTIYHGGLLDHRSGVVQPLSYARGLAGAAIKNGATIYENSPVTKIVNNGADWRLETPSGSLTARTVVIATNGYTGPETGSNADRLHKSYIGATSCLVATEPLPEAVRGTILPGGQSFSNSKRILTYCRLDPEGRLVVGGRGRFSGQDAISAYRAVEKSMRHIFPQIKDTIVTHRWYGRICLTPDQLPHLYQASQGLFVAMGYNGRGIAMATAFGKEIAARINNPDDQDLLNTRPLPAIPFYGLRRLGVAGISSYYRLLDLLG